MNWLSLDRKQLANVENSLKEIIARAADEDSHTQFTPLALCQELVQKIIDQGISPDKEWLVIANLEILFVVRAWFVYNGWSLDKLHYASASDRKLKFAKCLLGNENVSKYEYDKLKEWDSGMKFDVILSNPPYQGIGSTNKTHSLWKKFIKLSLEISKKDGILLFVTPQTLLTCNKTLSALTSFDLTTLTFLNPNVFNVGVSICYWLLIKQEYGRNTRITHYELDESFDTDLSTFGTVPSNFNNMLDLSIQQKVLFSKTPMTFLSSPIYSVSKTRSEINKFTTINLV